MAMTRLQRTLHAWAGPTSTADVERLEADWREWLTTLFRPYVTGGFAQRHKDFWAWVWAIERGERPSPFVAIWPRGGAKSTSAELACVAIGARQRRHYALYVSGTQDQADDHVQNVASLLEAATLERYYPDLASRLVGKFGNVRGWRRNRLRTPAFTIDALGLDTAARGVKLEEHRPDFIVLDDIDGELDSTATVEKKIKTLTTKLLPAGANDLAVLAVQNLIHTNSVFARLADGRAEFLADRIVSGPHPAVEGLAYEQRNGRYVIVAGKATWEGQDLARCQAMIDSFGISAFLAEVQHEVEAPDGGMFSHLVFAHCERAQVPALEDVQVWCDPAVTNTDNSDSHGIQADGRGVDKKIYRLFSWEGRTTPLDVLCRAILKALELKASCVGVETDQGGDLWQDEYDTAWRHIQKEGHEYHTMLQALIEARVIGPTPRKPAFRQAKAGAGHGPKTHRAAQMLNAYETGELVHVIGTHAVLEQALRRFPRSKPFDLVDAGYWSWTHVKEGARLPIAQPVSPSRWAITGEPNGNGSRWKV